MPSTYKLKISYYSKKDNSEIKPVKGQYFRPFFNKWDSQKSNGDGVVEFEALVKASGEEKDYLTNNYPNEKIYLVYGRSGEPLSGSISYYLNSEPTGNAHLIISYLEALELNLI